MILQAPPQSPTRFHPERPPTGTARTIGENQQDFTQGLVVTGRFIQRENNLHGEPAKSDEMHLKSETMVV